MQPLSPTNASERETFLDALRGVAILGIFIANLSGFSWYSDGAGVISSSPYIIPAWDDGMFFLHQMFLEGKFYSIFSLLFGWGIALQIKRAASRGIDVLPVIRRRLFFMLLLGAVHLLMWSGDIVFLYAMLGFLLLPFRKLSNKTILIAGFSLTLLPVFLYIGKAQFPWMDAPRNLLINIGMRLDEKLIDAPITSEKDFSIYLANADWWQVLKSNVSGFFYRYQYLFFVSRFPKVLGVFLIGFALGRSDFFKNIKQHIKTVRIIVVVGLLIGLPANYMLAVYMSKYPADYWILNHNGVMQTIYYALGVLPLSLVYTGILMLVYQRISGKKFLSVFAPVGKMAFSNYIFQTLVGSYVFLGAGLGYISKVGPFCYTILGIAVFLLQVLLSHLWLRRFNYGPVEWLWRSATYKKWQPMVKRAIPVDGA